MTDWLTPEQRKRNMTAIKSSGTAAERRLEALVADAFPRRKVIARPDLPGRPDFYLPGLKLAVFADGCFWHGCPQHGRVPHDNREYWERKLSRNKDRDRSVRRELRAIGVRTIRFWDHDLRDQPGNVRSRLLRTAS